MFGPTVVEEFVAKAAELIRLGDAVVGAVYDPAKAAFDGIGLLSCPWCGVGAVIMVLAADHADTGEMAGGPSCWAVCEHKLGLQHLWSHAQARTRPEGIKWRCPRAAS